ncbi:hypothetical protein KY284_010234 [Solanum tuberosum]|nr:hypothetical protein KY284_010234 [Solanum tuberosum]
MMKIDRGLKSSSMLMLLSLGEVFNFCSCYSFNGLRGVGIGTKTSPALEKIQAEMRHECAGQAVNKRILESLEKDGNPSEIKHVNFVSPSVQSTSLKCNKKKRK